MPIAGRRTKYTRFALRKRKQHSSAVLCKTALAAEECFGLEADAEQ